MWTDRFEKFFFMVPNWTGPHKIKIKIIDSAEALLHTCAFIVQRADCDRSAQCCKKLTNKLSR